MDEASQVSVPASLGPLRLASAFLLVGDHYQLPPLVKSRRAQEEGLNQSLFALLASAHPSAIAMLRLQYRMNADIMAISNALVYGGLLLCGNEQVSHGRLDLEKSVGCCKGCAACWFRLALDPVCPVLFLDTDLCEAARETPVATSFSNAFEVNLIQTVHGALDGPFFIPLDCRWPGTIGADCLGDLCHLALPSATPPLCR